MDRLRGRKVMSVYRSRTRPGARYRLFIPFRGRAIPFPVGRRKSSSLARTGRRVVFLGSWLAFQIVHCSLRDSRMWRSEERCVGIDCAVDDTVSYFWKDGKADGI